MSRLDTGTGGFLESLYDLNPVGQIIGGVCCLLGGAALTWALWETGWLWGFSFVVIIAGASLVFTGIQGVGREKEAKRQWDRMRRDEEAIIAQLVEMKQSGGRPVPWLLKQGFRDRKVRNHLLDAMHERLGTR